MFNDHTDRSPIQNNNIKLFPKGGGDRKKKSLYDGKNSLGTAVPKRPKRFPISFRICVQVQFNCINRVNIIKSDTLAGQQSRIVKKSCPANA